MSEATFVRGLVRRLREYGAFVQRIEDSIARGVPDIFAVLDGQAFWIEAKYRERWPARASTKVRVGLRPEQVIWLMDCWDAGGWCYVVLRVGRSETLWFRGADARRIADGMTADRLRKIAIEAPENRPPI